MSKAWGKWFRKGLEIFFKILVFLFVVSVWALALIWIWSMVARLIR